MNSSIKKLEDFFETSFEPLNASSSDTRHLVYFDDFVQWNVLLVEDKQCLFISADKTALVTAFPIIEITVFFSGIHLDFLPSWGHILYILPKGEEYSDRLIAITKSIEGRLSSASTMGESEQRGKFPSHWFEDENSTP